MGGPETTLLTKSSATHCRSWENGPEHVCAINRTHSNLVKFSLHDEEYDKVLQRLKGLAQRALTVRKRIRDSSVKCKLANLAVLVRAEAVVLVPYNKNEDLVGRSGILEDIKQQLGYGQRQTAAKLRSKLALYGLGGVGCVLLIVLTPQYVG